MEKLKGKKKLNEMTVAQHDIVLHGTTNYLKYQINFSMRAKFAYMLNNKACTQSTVILVCKLGLGDSCRCFLIRKKRLFRISFFASPE